LLLPDTNYRNNWIKMIGKLDEKFLEYINANAGIAHKVLKVYFDDTDEREDVWQEMMYQLWRSYPGFNGKSKFSTWMYKVCLNTALTIKRRNRNQKTEPLSSVHLEIPLETPENKNEEAVQLLLQAISTLSPLNKAIVLLYLENMSYEEIATVVGITQSNVSVRLVRIKKELESRIKSKIKSINDVNT
jgi:RNA polymerase sigma factor (sigma-70 family)